MGKKESRIGGKGQLSKILSELKGFERPKVRLEQYITEPEIAADVLWKAIMLGDITKEVSVADLGAGPGSLGLGALLLGATRVFLVDSDKDALETAKSNAALLKSEGWLPKKGAVEFKVMDVGSFNVKVDLVLVNPPFGVKKKHADKPFLNKSAELAKVIYSFHKSESAEFAKRYMEDRGFKVTHVWNFDFALKATQTYHIRRVMRIKVSCLRFEKAVLE